MGVCLCVMCFFFRQNTAYELRISDWSSDVCSSDLIGGRLGDDRRLCRADAVVATPRHRRTGPWRAGRSAAQIARRARKSVVSGKSVSVRVDLGGRRIIKKKKAVNTLALNMSKVIDLNALSKELCCKVIRPLE